MFELIHRIRKRRAEAEAMKSGRIALNGSVVDYQSTLYGNWSPPLSGIRVIGEATNDYGPFADDYFFYFATVDAVWFEASYYAQDCDQFFASLCERLGSMQLQLTRSATFASNIPWPPAFAGRPMFRYTTIPPKTWIGRLVGLCSNRQRLSPHAIAAIRQDP